MKMKERNWVAKNDFNRASVHANAKDYKRTKKIDDFEMLDYIEEENLETEILLEYNVEGNFETQNFANDIIREKFLEAIKASLLM